MDNCKDCGCNFIPVQRCPGRGGSPALNMGLCFVAVLLSLGLAAGAGTVGVVTALDPGRISAWTQQWPGLPVELSYTNAQETNVVVMLRANLPSGLTNGVVEVIFPSSFDVTTTFCMQTNCQKQPTIQGQVVVLLGVNLPAGNDTTITLGGITNPPRAGGYGPFGIRTRPYPGGQTIDINLAFASVGITGQVGNMKTIDVTTPAGVPQIRVSGLALDFSFVLSKDLWRHDTVRITISKYWNLTNPVCVSKAYPGRTAVAFVGEGSGQQLSCSVSDQASSPDGGQILYVYGLGVDLEISANDNNKYVMLEVTGFTSPYYDYPDGMYQWRVETMRCTTRNVLERGNILSGPTVNPAVISSATWKSTWPYGGDSMLLGMQMYMDMSFTLPFEVPFGGYIQVLTNGASVNTVWGGVSCYLTQKYQGADPARLWVQNIASCAATGAYSIQVSNLPALNAASPFTFRSLVTFQSGPTVEITSITSYTSEGYAINAGYRLGTITLNTADYLLSTFDILLSKAASISSDAAITGGTSDYSYYLKFRIDPRNEELRTTSVFNISCPFANTLDDFRISFTQDANTRYQVRKDTRLGVATDFTDNRALTQTVTSGSSPTIAYSAQGTTGLDSIEISSKLATGVATPLDISTLAGEALVLGISRANAGTGMRWPRVATNAATTYECYITVVDSTPKSTNTSPLRTQRGVAQFTITPRSLFSKSVNYFCSYNTAGAPIYISIQPDLFSVPSSSVTEQYYVEFDFPEPQLTRSSDEALIASGTYLPRFGSGLPDYSDYPYDLDDPVNSFQPSLLSTLSFQIYSENQKTKLRLTNFDTISTAQSYAIDFPVGKQVKPGDTSVIIRTYYQKIADPRVKYIYHEDFPTVTTSNSASNSFTGVSWTFGNIVPNGELLSQTARLQVRTNVNAVSQNSNWLYFVLPRGYSLVNSFISEGNWDIWNAVGNFTQQHVFTSPNPNFNFPSIIAQCTVNSCVNALASRFVEIYGIKPALGMPCGYNDKITVVVSNRNDKAGACLAATTLEHIVVMGDITITQLQPQEVLARGPDAMDISAKVTFRTTHGGYSDSWLALTINPEFETIAGVTSCEVQGLSAFNATTPVRCVMIGNAVTIDQFADFTATPAILISVSIHHLLPPVRDWSTRSHFLSSFLSWTQDGRKIDTIKVTDADLIAVQPALPSGRSSVYQLQTVPLNGQQAQAALYLSFSLPHEIPALAGKIDIQSPVPLNYAAGNIQNKCWVTGMQYTSCVADGARKVSLSFVQTLAADAVVEVYLDGAISGLAAGTYSTTSFALISYWGPGAIDNDLQPDSALFINTKEESHRLLPLATPQASILPVSFSFDPTTALEVSTYSFTFQLSARLELAHQLWFQFPQDSFDAYIGPAVVRYSEQPTTYYLSCSSQELGAVECIVDHWAVFVKPGRSIEPSRDITMHIQVYNPPSGAGYRIDMSHLSDDENAIAVLQGLAVVIPTPPALNIVLKNLTISSNNLRDFSTTRFSLYLSQTLNTTSLLQAVFPHQYQLLDPLPCASTFRDVAAGATVTGNQDWNAATTCPVQGANTLTLASPASAYSFDSSKIITLTVNVSNPEWGSERAGDKLWDFDKFNEVSQPNYDVWTDQWQLFVYDTAAKAYTSRTYPNLHCGYTGFFSAKLQLQVGNYTPSTDMNRIIVGTGLQTQPITLSVPNPCRSKSIQLQAKVSPSTPDQGYITVSSDDNFVLYQTESQFNVKISADEKLQAGRYLLEWRTMETTQEGVSTSLYYPPAQTVLEVSRTAENSIPITLTYTQSVAIGARSVPIQVRLAYPPATKLIVNLALALSLRDVSVYPELLFFGPGQDTAYFEITLSSDFDLSATDQLLLNFWLGGENADLYMIPRWSAVDITGIRAADALPSVLDWGVQGCTRKTCRLAPSFSVPGVFYWRLAAQGTPPLSLSALTANIDRLSDAIVVGGEDQSKDHNYLDDFRPASETDPALSESWESFQRRLYKAHLMTSYYGRALQYSTSTSLEFTWLWAGTQYELTGYFVDQYEEASEMLSVGLETEGLADAGAVVMSVLASNVADTDLRNAAAELLGVNPARLALNWQNSTVTMTVAADRFVDGQDPTSLSFPFASLAAALPGAQVLSLSFSPDTTRSSINITHINATRETTFLTLSSETVTPASQVCCIAQHPTSELASPTQVWLGLNSLNQYIPHSCNFNSTSVLIAGLIPNTEYLCQCVAADAYPLWRTLGFTYQTTVFTEAVDPLIQQQQEYVPQAGGNMIVVDVNTAAWTLALGSLLALS